MLKIKPIAKTLWHDNTLLMVLGLIVVIALLWLILKRYDTDLAVGNMVMSGS